MGKITIEFDTDNAAFENASEVSLILSQASNKVIRNMNIPGEDTCFCSLYDSNGNKVGSVRIDN